jgi:hypothetical protein
VIASDHDDPDTGPPTPADRLGDLRADRVGHAHEPEKLHPRFGIRGRVRSPALDLPPSEGQDPEPLGGQRVHRREDLAFLLLSKRRGHCVHPDALAQGEDRLR